MVKGPMSDAEFAAQERYFTAFGRLIYYFSKVEHRLHLLLWEMSGTSLEVARVAFGDARYDKITSMISRLHRSRKETEHPAYRRAIDQMGIINAARNNLVHWEIQINHDASDVVASASNVSKSLPNTGSTIAYNVSDLVLMARDLRTILSCLYVVLRDIHPNKPVDIETDKIIREAALSAWLYKQPKQSGGGPKAQQRPQARKPRRSPSGQ